MRNTWDQVLLGAPTTQQTGGQNMGRESLSRPARGLLLPGGLAGVAVLSTIISMGSYALLVSPAESTPEYMGQFNSKYDTRGTKLDSCMTCHTSQAGGAENLNPYGSDFAKNNHDFGAAEGLDSDGDGFKNIDEIKAETFPGDPNDNPNTKPAPEPPPTSTTTTTRPFPFSLLPEGLPRTEK